MAEAIQKAKLMLEENGILIIVGLAKPSNFFDWVIELSRIIPSGIMSAVKQNTSSEELAIDVSYAFPTMGEVRRIGRKFLPGCKLRHGLHYRYLLTWKNIYSKSADTLRRTS